MRLVTAVSLVFLLAVPTLALATHENNIGLYITPTPDTSLPVDSSQAQLVATGGTLYEVYFVCSNPVNMDTGEPITLVFGFECGLVLPSGWIVNGAVFPAGVVSFDNPTAGRFYCSGPCPVDTSGPSPIALLATVTIFSFQDPDAGYVYLTPHPVFPSIPGGIAITDGNDEFSLHQAYPSSGDFELPVLGINAGVVPAEDTTWSE